MNNMSTDITSVEYSVRVYQLLLDAYPTKFRQEYGSQMAQVFQDCCLRAVHQGGRRGLFMLWALTLLDFIRSVFEQYLQKETDMNNSSFIRLGGWLMILGAIAFLPGAIGMLFWESQTIDWDTPPMQLAAFAVFLAPLLLGVGMLGLRARYRIGSGVLLFGAAIGSILVIVGNLGQMFAPVYSISETYYGVWLGGVLVLNVCLFIFGVLALIQKPLPRLNWLPLAAGASLPIIPLLSGITGGPPSSPIIIAVLVIMTLAQVMLGYMLQADVTDDTKTSQQGQPA